MNILFFVDADITINRGGVSRVTHFLSRKFMEKNNKCYLAYLFESKEKPLSEFDGKIHLQSPKDDGQLKDYIQQQGIDVVICSLILKSTTQQYLPLLYKIRKEIKTTHIIFCYHIYPGFELISPQLNVCFYHLFHKFQISKKICASVLTACALKSPIKIGIKKYLKRKYLFAYHYSDKIVLLSSGYIPSYLKIIQLDDYNHFRAIPNPLTGESPVCQNLLSTKQKQVLIVSRLSENQKRISQALKIWQIIEKQGICKEWELTIVGTGEDEPYYRHLTKKLSLKQVTFKGWCNPTEYYRTASLFMMTSQYEGWGLTLTEALQWGVVPVAFDNFISIHDIITDNENGFLIPEQNIHLYANKLIQLMNDSETRRRMAADGIKSCEKFNMDQIIGQWTQLFEELKTKESF